MVSRLGHKEQKHKYLLLHVLPYLYVHVYIYLCVHVCIYTLCVPTHTYNFISIHLTTRAGMLFDF